MKRGAFPEVAELIPHARRMLLLDRVLEHGPEHAVCTVDVDRSELFQDAEGCVPAWVGLEYLAQCMAVYGSLVARADGQARRGFGPFIGGRRLKLRVDRFRPGQVLRVTRAASSRRPRAGGLRRSDRGRRGRRAAGRGPPERLQRGRRGRSGREGHGSARDAS